MKMNEQDILKEKALQLRENPFGVPEGYFSAMRERASKAVEKRVVRPVTKAVRILAPTFSVAAALALFFIGKQQYERRQAALLDPQLYSESVASSLSHDEIVDYLIYTGASVEEIRNYEEF